MTPQYVLPAEVEVDETIWNAWLKKGHRQDVADDRRTLRLLGFLFFLLIATAIFYWIPRG